ncbi:MAG TPA: hypothetical protein ENN60_03725 [archaeon]|nr:hypothetical protein [archaeon]
MAGLIGVLLSEGYPHITLFYSLSGVFLALTMFMYGLPLAGLVALLSSAGGGVAMLLFGGELSET